MTNKKQEWARVGIYTFLAFAPMWCLTIYLNNKYGYENYMNDLSFSFITVLLMFPPAAAHLITRAVTKEGFNNMYLHLRLKGNIKKYLIAILLPVICGFLGSMILGIAYKGLDFNAVSPAFAVGNIAAIISNAGAGAWITFGEEFGWRAYLYPKLEKLTGATVACFIGGTIWGVWHAPLIIGGHNFGTEYWGYPWLGIAFMTLICISYGAVLMWLTNKTKTVYPAALFHAVTNAGATMSGAFYVIGIEDLKPEISHFAMMFIPTFISGAVFLILIISDSRKAKK